MPNQFLGNCCVCREPINVNINVPPPHQADFEHARPVNDISKSAEQAWSGACRTYQNLQPLVPFLHSISDQGSTNPKDFGLNALVFAPTQTVFVDNGTRLEPSLPTASSKAKADYARNEQLAFVVFPCRCIAHKHCALPIFGQQMHDNPLHVKSSDIVVVEVQADRSLREVTPGAQAHLYAQINEEFEPQERENPLYGKSGATPAPASAWVSGTGVSRANPTYVGGPKVAENANYQGWYDQLKVGTRLRIKKTRASDYNTLAPGHAPTAPIYVQRAIGGQGQPAQPMSLTDYNRLAATGEALTIFEPAAASATALQIVHQQTYAIPGAVDPETQYSMPNAVGESAAAYSMPNAVGEPAVLMETHLDGTGAVPAPSVRPAHTVITVSGISDEVDTDDVELAPPTPYRSYRPTESDTDRRTSFGGHTGMNYDNCINFNALPLPQQALQPLDIAPINEGWREWIRRNPGYTVLIVAGIIVGVVVVGAVAGAMLKSGGGSDQGSTPSPTPAALNGTNSTFAPTGQHTSDGTPIFTQVANTTQSTITIVSPTSTPLDTTLASAATSSVSTTLGQTSTLSQTQIIQSTLSMTSTATQTLTSIAQSTSSLQSTITSTTMGSSSSSSSSTSTSRSTTASSTTLTSTSSTTTVHRNTVTSGGGRRRRNEPTTAVPLPTMHTPEAINFNHFAANATAGIINSVHKINDVVKGPYDSYWSMFKHGVRVFNNLGTGRKVTILDQATSDQLMDSLLHGLNDQAHARTLNAHSVREVIKKVARHVLGERFTQPIQLESGRVQNLGEVVVNHLINNLQGLRRR